MNASARRSIAAMRLRQSAVVSLVLTLAASPLAGSDLFASSSTHPPARADCPLDSPEVTRTPITWEPPLDRVVSLRATGEPLRRVLETLASAGGVRISYSDQVLPLERAVCATITEVPLGDVLRYLIGALAVDPIPVGHSHVVLSPAKRSKPALAAGDPPVFELASVVATSSASRAARLLAPHAVTVIERDQLVRLGDAGLARALNVLVPGFWSRPSPGAGFLGVSSLRGASSFGGSVPKVYLDGIEVADPGLLAGLAPDAVERVEVIRGPQGSALYGANAINGVIHIVTRRGAAVAGAPRAELRSSGVLRQQGSAIDDLLLHDHTFNLRGGTSRNWARMTLSAGTSSSATVAEPEVGYSGVGNARLVMGPAILTGTSRFHLESSAAGRVRYPSRGMLIAGPGHGDATPAESRTGGRPGLTQYTLGATLDLMQSDRWTHKLVAGVDGYRLRYHDADRPLSTPERYGPDPAASRGADRTTLRLTSTLDFPTLDRSRASLAFTAEQRMSQRHEGPPAESLAGDGTRGVAPAGDARLAYAIGAGRGSWRRTTGLAGQANLSFDETLFVTAGLRLEGSSGTIRLTPLPQLGASVLTGGDQWSLRLRTAYGRAMSSPVDIGAHAAGAQFPTNLLLEPEMQAGIEAGLTFELADRIGIDVTRFDQTATNLVQWLDLGVHAPTSARNPHPYGGHGYVLQNLGEIANRGWEVQGRITHDRASLVASAATVDSRATQLPSGYSGDLQVGDRVLSVPAHTVALMGGWHADRWGLSLTLSRAWDWIDYDRERLAANLPATGTGGRALPLSQLRDYWKRYDGALAADASIDVHLTSRMGVTLRIDNMFDAPLAGASDLTAFSGRTAGVEVRLQF